MKILLPRVKRYQNPEVSHFIWTYTNQTSTHYNRRSYIKGNNTLLLVLLLLFTHSGYFYSASTSPLLLRGAPATARILCRSFMPCAVGNCEWRIAQDPYVAARAGLEYTTIRTKGNESTDRPTLPTSSSIFSLLILCQNLLSTLSNCCWCKQLIFNRLHTCKKGAVRKVRHAIFV